MPHITKESEERLREDLDKIEGIDWEYIYELKRIKFSELTVDDFEQADYWIKEKIVNLFISALDREVGRAVEEERKRILHNLSRLPVDVIGINVDFSDPHKNSNGTKYIKKEEALQAITPKE